VRKTLDHDTNYDSKLTATAATLSSMLDCGRATAVIIGTEAGARIQIGRRVLFIVPKVQEYLRKAAEQ